MSSSLNQSLLITGGLGFIGAYTAQEWLRKFPEAKVTLLDLEPSGATTAEKLGLLDNPRVQTLLGSIQDEVFLASVGTEYSHIIHAAGVLGITKVVRNPILTLDVNIIGTRNVLGLASRQSSLARFLTLSTSEIYGSTANGNSEESDAVIGTNYGRWGYASAKLASEFYTKAFGTELGIPFVLVRPFNVYGPHRSGGNAITSFAEAALRGEDIHISGDGYQERSWCHISDFVSGVLLALNHQSASGGTFNIGDDRTLTSILDLAHLIVSRSGSSSKVIISGSIEPDVKSRRPDLRKAREVLGYNPTIGLLDGIDDVLNAHTTHDSRPRAEKLMRPLAGD